MKVFLISGAMHNAIVNYDSISIVNNTSFTLDDLKVYLESNSLDFDIALITDEAFSLNLSKDKESLNFLIHWIEKSTTKKSKILILTRDFALDMELSDLRSRYTDINIHLCEFVRIPMSLFGQVINKIPAKKEKKLKPNKFVTPKNTDVAKKKSVLDMFRPKPKENKDISATDSLTRELNNMSRGLSKIVAITGHRGSGLTSTVVNVAYEADKYGLSTIIVDLDTDYRSTNMYFSAFNELSRRDETINSSLVRTTAKPYDYMTTAFNIKSNLWLTALGYSFDDTKVLEQFYNGTKLIGLLSVLRSKFNLVILDLPMDSIKYAKEILIHMDVAGICIPNNLYSVLGALRNMELVLDSESISFLNSKSKLIVTKHNSMSNFQEEAFTPEKVSEVLTSGLNENFCYEIPVAGYVPYVHEFDSQIENDCPIVSTNTELEKAYGGILLRLLEGVK